MAFRNNVDIFSVGTCQVTFKSEYCSTSTTLYKTYQIRFSMSAREPDEYPSIAVLLACSRYLTIENMHIKFSLHLHNPIVR